MRNVLVRKSGDTQYSRFFLEHKDDTGRGACTHKSKNVQHRAEVIWNEKIKIGSTGNQLTNTTLGLLLAKTPEQERPRHLCLSLRCRSYCKPVQTAQQNDDSTDRKRQNVKKKSVYNKNTKEHLVLARLQIGLGRDVHWEWPDQSAAWMES